MLYIFFGLLFAFTLLTFSNGKDVCALKEEVKLEEMVTADVKDDGSSLISKTMVEEEEKLLEARIKEEEVQYEEAVDLNDIQFNKLDELLTQTRLYSEFLLEKMDDITLVIFNPLLPFFFCYLFKRVDFLFLLHCSYSLNICC